MKSIHRFFFIILIGLSSVHQASCMGFARFARNVFSRAKYTQPTSLAYLFAMRSYERRLDDGTVQQLHVGSDGHIELPEETQQVQDVINHMKKHPKKSCLAITEDMKGPSEHQQLPCPEMYAHQDIFLYKLAAACAAQDMPHINIEFRDITQAPSRKYPNNATIAEVFSHFENYARTFKHDAIAKNILTEHDFEHLDDLRKELEPHMHKTVQVLHDDGRYQPSWLYAIWRAVTKPNSEIRARENIRKSENKLLEDCALYHVATAQMPNIYLNMGGNHIEKASGSEGIGIEKRLTQQGWRHVHTSGLSTEKAVELFDKGIPIDVAHHFATLPERGSALHGTNA